MANKTRSSRKRMKILQLERTLNEEAPKGKEVLGENYQKRNQRNTESLCGQNTPYTQTITPQSSKEPTYKQPTIYHPTD